MPNVQQPVKILVVGPSWVGDMVMAQSLFMVLKAQMPDCLVDVLAPAWALALLPKMPEVHQAIAMPLRHGHLGLRQRYQLGKQLKLHHYTWAIVLPNSWKSALIPFFAGIPRRTGFLGECRWGLLNDYRQLDKSLLTMTVQRFVALGLPQHSQPQIGDCPQPTLPVGQQQAVLEKFQLLTSKPILALCPGAEYGPAKRWPEAHFAEIAKVMVNKGWQVWLFGSEKDQVVANSIDTLSGHICTNLAGHTSLSDAVELMAFARAVVSNDSGLMHIAAALGKDIIALYGSSDPKFTPPLHKKAKIITLNLACSPCFKRECPLYPKGHPRHTECLNGISPDQVIAQLDVLQ